MSSFGATNNKQNKQFETKIQGLQLQLSEKSNEVLKLKDRIETLELRLEEQANTISE